MNKDRIEELRASRDHSRRSSVARALGETCDAGAIEALREALWDREPDVRLSAGLALVALGDARAFEALYEAVETNLYRDSRDGCPASGRPIGKYFAADSPSSVRHSAVEAIAVAKIDDARAIEVLCRALGDESWQVVDCAVKGLSSLRNARAVESLCKVLEAGEGRDGAARALGNIGDARAVEPLYKALQDRDGEVRSAAVSALRGFRDARAVEALCNALQGRDGHVSAKAAEALGSIGDARAIKPLCRAFVEEKASYNSPVRGSALMALVRFGAPAAEALIEALEEADQLDRREARKDLAILTRGVYDVAVRIFADQVAAKFDAKEKADSSEL